MPRQRRLVVVGGIYHVIQRGIERRVIFVDRDDRLEFLQRLEKGLKLTGDACYAWSLMPNHFHLLIRSGDKPIGARGEPSSQVMLSVVSKGEVKQCHGMRG